VVPKSMPMILPMVLLLICGPVANSDSMWVTCG
jgi:hypothetical protein